MKTIKKLFVISLKNLKCRKWLSAKIVIALAVFMFFISLFTVFFVSTNIVYESYPNYRVSVNYIFSRTEITEGLPNDAKFTKIQYGYNSERLTGILGRQEEVPIWGTYFLYYYRVNIEVDGKEYEYLIKPDINKPQVGFTDIFYVYAWDNELFTENDYAELKLRFGLDSFIIGEIPQKEDEILISAEMLSYYGLSEKDVLGKKLTFNYSANEKKVNQNTQETYDEKVEYGKIWEPYKVTGIIRQEYYQLAGHNPNEYYFFGGICLPSVCMLPSTEAFADPEYSGGYFYRYSFKDWLSKELLDKYNFNGYGGLAVINHLNFIKQIQEIVTYLFLILGACFGAGALFMIYLMMDKFVRYFARNGGSLLACGISRREFTCVSCIQIILISFAAAVISFCLTTLIYYILSVKLSTLIIYGSAFDILILDSTFFMTLFAVEVMIMVLVGACMIFNTYFLTRKKSVKELMNASIG